MRYSTLGGGKRFRPLILLASYELGGNPDGYAAAIAAGGAIELVHCFSLVHDDLPALDNDELRRGKPSCHKQFGEAMAILAGDAMFALAFGTIAAMQCDEGVRREAFQTLAGSVKEMVEGQTLDILSHGEDLDLERLELMHRKKTGALIGCACKIGAMIGGCAQSVVDACEEIGSEVGLLFQIHDDLLDATSETGKLGKPVGSDEQNEKATYVKFLGIEGARELVSQRSKEVYDRIGRLGPGSSSLLLMAKCAIEREH